MTRPRVLSHALVAGAMVAVCIAPVVANSEEYTNPILELPLQFEDCGSCLPSGCFGEQHRFTADTGGHDRAYSEDSHDCEWGFCADAHPHSAACHGLAPEALEELNERVWSAALAGDDGVRNLRALIEGFDENATFNSVRRAVQVKGCFGGIVLSVPVSTKQAAELAVGDSPVAD